MIERVSYEMRVLDEKTGELVLYVNHHFKGGDVVSRVASEQEKRWHENAEPIGELVKLPYDSELLPAPKVPKKKGKAK